MTGKLEQSVCLQSVLYLQVTCAILALISRCRLLTQGDATIGHQLPREQLGVSTRHSTSTTVQFLYNENHHQHHQSPLSGQRLLRQVPPERGERLIISCQVTYILNTTTNPAEQLEIKLNRMPAFASATPQCRLRWATVAPHTSHSSRGLSRTARQG